MSNLAIRVEGIGKLYRIGAERTSYGSLRESLTRGVGRRLSRLFNPRAKSENSGQQESFWALRDVSFDVQAGEVLGIIGRNGAGKSTLLKILSRITEPTEGQGQVIGRIGSLLEVGTGFHPELTGRENVFLNGAILGMRRVEILRKFDEIVEFADLRKFVDTPVKHYSSGMYLRLAFAVAAHLEPEILLIDEVLAVGDAQFQKKCIGKMSDVAKQGRTVLFVSHNMSAIGRLCSRVILLDNGQVVKDGKTGDVISTYLEGRKGVRDWSLDSAPGTQELRLIRVSLMGEGGLPTSVIPVGQESKLEIEYHVGKPNLKFRCAAVLHTQGVCAFTTLEPTELVRKAPGYYVSTVMIPPHLLTEDEYSVTISIFHSRGVKERFLRANDALTFQVFDPMTGRSARGDYANNFTGVVRPLLDWSLEFRGASPSDAEVENNRGVLADLPRPD